MMVKSYSYIPNGVLNLRKHFILSFVILALVLDLIDSFKILNDNGKPHSSINGSETMAQESYNFYSYNITSDFHDSTVSAVGVPTKSINETWTWGLDSKQQKLNINIPSRSRSLELKTATVRGLRIEESAKPVNYDEKGISVILADSGAVIRLFGDRFTKHTIIRFVTEMRTRGEDCGMFSFFKKF